MEKLAFCLLFLVVSLLFISGVLSASFTLSNNCDYTVWPGILSNAGSSPLSTTGFTLEKGETRVLTAPTSWSGRLWGRTHCSVDSSGKFSCGTGDCGSGSVECSGGGAAPPASLAEFTLNGSGGLDFFDVSLVDGYNLPMLVVPQGGTGGGKCSPTGCVVDLNEPCPLELQVVSSTDRSKKIACKSACESFRDPKYCCSGEFGNPNTCTPSTYSQFFKNSCPRAYSYAYDDASSTFTCASADYTITFCPTTTSQKTLKEQHPVAAHLLRNNTMVYVGGAEFNGGSRDSLSLLSAVIAILATAVLHF